MHVATDAEVLSFSTENEWHYGIKADGTTCLTQNPGANCIELKFPETPLRTTYFTEVASMLGIDEESQFYGALLWITLSTIGSPPVGKGRMEA